VGGGELAAQLGDFAAKFLVAPVRGLQPANQRAGRAPSHLRGHQVHPPPPGQSTASTDRSEPPSTSPVEPLTGTSRTRLTISLDFEGHGGGKVLVPLLVRSQSRKEMQRNMTRLKERLEAV
jgi:hypothetical protein